VQDNNIICIDHLKNVAELTCLHVDITHTVTIAMD